MKDGKTPAASPATRLERHALHHHDPAAERHRQPAHGPCADVHDAGYADPLAPDAGPRRAVAAGHRSRRHRHADGGGTAAGGRGQRPPGSWAARRSSSACGNGRRNPAAPSRRQLAPPGRLAGLAARALHHGRRIVGRGEGGVRHAVSRRPDLPRPAAGELGPEAADGDLRPGGGEPRDQRLALVSALSDRGRTRPVHHRRHHATGDDAGRHRRGGASRSSGLWRADRQAGDPAAGRPVDPDRRRHLCGPGKRHRRGKDHPGARFQRLRGRPPP